MEPARFGVPMVMGPHYENFREIVERLRAKDGIRVADVGGLSGVLSELLGDGEMAAAMGARAAEVFASETGATELAAQALLRLMAGEAA